MNVGSDYSSGSHLSKKKLVQKIKSNEKKVKHWGGSTPGPLTLQTFASTTVSSSPNHWAPIVS